MICCNQISDLEEVFSFLEIFPRIFEEVFSFLEFFRGSSRRFFAIFVQPEDENLQVFRGSSRITSKFRFLRILEEDFRFFLCFFEDPRGVFRFLEVFSSRILEEIFSILEDWSRVLEGVFRPRSDLQLQSKNTSFFDRQKYCQQVYSLLSILIFKLFKVIYIIDNNFKL